MQSISQLQSLKRNVTAVVELAIYLQFVISKIRNVDVVATLLRCVIHRKLLVTNNREIIVADHVNNNNIPDILTPSKLDMLTQKHLVMPHKIPVNGVYLQYNQQLSLVLKWN